MTKEEAVEKLNAMPTGGDEEILHAEADAILVERLRALGDAEVADAWLAAKERIVFWYA